jgi:hypothetical protein
MSRVIYDGIPVPDEPKASFSAAEFLAQAAQQQPMQTVSAYVPIEEPEERSSRNRLSLVLASLLDVMRAAGVVAVGLAMLGMWLIVFLFGSGLMTTYTLLPDGTIDAHLTSAHDLLMVLCMFGIILGAWWVFGLVLSLVIYALHFIVRLFKIKEKRIENLRRQREEQEQLLVLARIDRQLGDLR